MNFILFIFCPFKVKRLPDEQSEPGPAKVSSNGDWGSETAKIVINLEIQLTNEDIKKKK